MFRSYLASVLAGLASLALDQSCLACGIQRAPLCATCINSLNKTSSITRVSNFEIFSSYNYDKVFSKIVVNAKESRVRVAKDFLVEAIANSVWDLVRHKKLSFRELLIVPVPSTPAARRRRGEDFVFELAKSVQRALQTEPGMHQIKVKRLLRVNRQISDQANLSEFDRSQNLIGAFKVNAKLTKPIPIILIDDVITTGSTIREALRALQERNLTVIGGATACASQRRLPIR